MNIGCVYYSQTGHTKDVVEKIVSQLTNADHLVSVHRIQADSLSKSLEGHWDVSQYEALVIGTPVHGGVMAAPIRSFLKELRGLEGIQFALVVTHFFRRGWGAVQTLQEMQSICEAKGGIFLAQMDIKWLSIFRKKEITEAIRIYINQFPPKR